MPEALSIVIIDDNPGSLELLSVALAHSDAAVYTSSNPVEGLELVRKHRPRLVVTDLVMPDMSGLEVLQHVVSFDSVHRRDPDDGPLHPRNRRRRHTAGSCGLSAKAGQDRGPSGTRCRPHRGRKPTKESSFLLHYRGPRTWNSRVCKRRAIRCGTSLR